VYTCATPDPWNRTTTPDALDSASGTCATTSRRRCVESGERIVITVDGRPVAQLGPLRPDGATPTLADLAATGLLEPPRIGRAERADAAPEDPPVDVRVDRILDELRGR
jgi:antitoxin (DNA-binding transcriptional repressor) of toxin-antitoxin stability system